MHRSHIITAALAGCIACVGGATAVAQACSLDSTPSALANGRLARQNTDVPTTSAQLKTFTFFVFPGTYAANRPIALTEDRREVARSLIPDVMKRPWQWSFGDGKMAYGWTVRHSYARPGKWIINVSCYYPVDRKWHSFDQITITVSAAH